MIQKMIYGSSLWCSMRPFLRVGSVLFAYFRKNWSSWWGQVPPASVPRRILAWFCARLAMSRGNTLLLLCNASVYEYFGDSWSICQSRSHTEPTFGDFRWFWSKWTISRFRLRDTLTDRPDIDKNLMHTSKWYQNASQHLENALKRFENDQKPIKNT